MLALLSIFTSLFDGMNILTGTAHQNVTSMRSVSTTTPQNMVVGSIHLVHMDTHMHMPYPTSEILKNRINVKDQKMNYMDTSLISSTTEPLKTIETFAVNSDESTTLPGSGVYTSDHLTEPGTGTGFENLGNKAIEENQNTDYLQNLEERSYNDGLTDGLLFTESPETKKFDEKALNNIDSILLSSSYEDDAIIQSVSTTVSTGDASIDDDDESFEDQSTAPPDDESTDEETTVPAEEESTDANFVTIKPALGIREGKLYRIQNDMDDSYLTVIVDTKMGRNNLAKVSTAEFRNSNAQLWSVKKYKTGYFLLPKNYIPNEISTRRNNKLRQWQIISSDSHPGAVKLVSSDHKECVGSDGGLQISYCSHAVNWNFISEKKFYKKLLINKFDK